jgi:hypothetical protein
MSAFPKSGRRGYHERIYRRRLEADVLYTVIFSSRVIHETLY